MWLNPPGNFLGLRPFDGFCARLTGFCARFAHEFRTSWHVFYVQGQRIANQISWIADCTWPHHVHTELIVPNPPQDIHLVSLNWVPPLQLLSIALEEGHQLGPGKANMYRWSGWGYFKQPILYIYISRFCTSCKLWLGNSELGLKPCPSRSCWSWKGNAAMSLGSSTSYCYKGRPTPELALHQAKHPQHPYHQKVHNQLRCCLLLVFAEDISEVRPEPRATLWASDDRGLQDMPWAEA